MSGFIKLYDTVSSGVGSVKVGVLDYLLDGCFRAKSCNIKVTIYIYITI